MRVLHLFSNAKWTGPAEPALNLCVALRRRGVEADFACCPDSGASVNKIVETARDRDVEPILSLHLYKHKNPVYNFMDRMGLRKLMRARRYDLVHCHLDNDHRIAIGALGKSGVPIVRSSYEGLGFEKPKDHARMLAQTAWLIEPSRRALDHDTQAYAFPAERACVIPGAVDTERFDPARELPDGRRWLNISHDAFVVGIVARMQTHRHYEDFFAALRRLADNHPNVHVIVIGRGTNQEKVGFAPVRDLGLEKLVHFTGYLDGENYVGMLKAFDAKVFMVPGSDGTCRAVREAMAMARPAVVADRGMLPEIVHPGVDGFVFDNSVDSLYDCLNQLASDSRRAREMGRAARATALAEYSLDAQVDKVLDVYGRL
jgi:glycosyltransferase involved in cell wall biosynthesis